MIAVEDFRARIHAGLSGSLPGRLTWAQRFSAAMILLSVGFAIAITEPDIAARVGRWISPIELAFATWFAAEYLLRLWSVGEDPRYAGLQGRVRYAVTPMALLDLLSIAPFFAGWGSQSFVIRLLRLFRLLALSRLVRYSMAMRLVLDSIYSRRHELLFSISLAGSVILISAAALYSVEAELQPDAFGSIPRALWWSVCTLTTVGYGDVVPHTAWGKVFAGLTAMSGIGLIAMPTGILAGAFSEAFAAKRRNTE
ncbi:Potassium channel protein [Lysobacter dokdonensis DS-58]|uniref:Potassium channel protein n=1 Tax=Lysobacter dokdonensis DS-58 TaxID=1300345 RepID=A0A0A2WM27_9GAMM|nr:potassium channel family protein [Lysobacter dokdonensis]KGQ19777.1 Potassium channel protein [Lysobacter dokdonensis DS-58]